MAKTRLQEKYVSEVVNGLVDKFQYKNVMEIPKIEKIIINMGIGEAVANSKALDAAVSELITIAGQKPVVTKAKRIAEPIIAPITWEIIYIPASFPFIRPERNTPNVIAGLM